MMIKSNLKLNGGFTLMELLVVVAVMGILITAGTQIFYRSIRGSSRVELSKTFDAGAEHIVNTLNRSLSEVSILTVGTFDRNNCLAAGTGGVTDSSMIVRDLNGNSISYSLSGDVFKSGSFDLNNSGDFEVSNLNFTWYCGEAVMDRVKIDFVGTARGNDNESVVVKDFSFEVLLRNTGE